MRYRVWHLLLAMVIVSLWLPVSAWLLALEATDHANKPQAVADFIGFCLGSFALVILPLTWLALVLKNRR